MVDYRETPKGKRQCELRYYFKNMLEDMPTLEMVRLLHERLWIKPGYQQLKEGLGVDHHEGRSWTGCYRYVLLVRLAIGYLSHLRLQEKTSDTGHMEPKAAFYADLGERESNQNLR